MPGKQPGTRPASTPPTWKKTYEYHPLGAWADHGATGTGEPLAIELPNGRAGSNTVGDHRHVLIDALKQLPFAPNFHLQDSVGFALTETTATAVDSIPATA